MSSACQKSLFDGTLKFSICIRDGVSNNLQTKDNVKISSFCIKKMISVHISNIASAIRSFGRRHSRRDPRPGRRQRQTSFKANATISVNHVHVNSKPLNKSKHPTPCLPRPQKSWTLLGTVQLPEISQFFLRHMNDEVSRIICFHKSNTSFQKIPTSSPQNSVHAFDVN